MSADTAENHPQTLDLQKPTTNKTTDRLTVTFEDPKDLVPGDAHNMRADAVDVAEDGPDLRRRHASLSQVAYPLLDLRLQQRQQQQQSQSKKSNKRDHHTPPPCHQRQQQQQTIKPREGDQLT